MLQLEGISKQLGPRIILDGVDFRVNDRERIAIVGRNGAGKSTLLKIAVGRIELDSGRILLSRGQDVGYLAQDHQVNADRTLWEEAQDAVEPVLDLEREATALLARLGTEALSEPEQLDVLEQADALQEQFRIRGGYRIEADVGRVLTGLGFVSTEWSRPAGTFSGGWQVRIALARLLLTRPSFLLLDEPTNHLDIETRTWLLHELRGYPGGVVVVGHDRDFLDRLVQRTVEVRAGGVTSTTGGYTAWVKGRTERVEQLRKAAIERAEERGRIEAFVNRFRYKASKAAAVQSRIKMLARLPPIVVPEDDVRPKLRFPEPPPSASPMLELRDVGKAYGDTRVFQDANATILPGDRILLVGANGAGKTTLLKLLAAQERPDDGYVRPHSGTRTAWFAQDQATALGAEQSVLSAVAAADPLLSEARLRTALGAMLFSGDDVYKPCGVLSGGERSRVALARILLQRANLLLLDEPTNHLDVDTKEVFAEALLQYTGALLIVSHDRVFANAVANQVWELGDGTIRRHVGGLDDFLWAKAIELGVVTRRAPGQRAPDAWLLKGLPETEDKEGTGGPGGHSAPDVQPEAEVAEGGGKEGWEDRKQREREERKRTRRLEELVATVDELEVQMAALDARLASPDVAADWDRMQVLLSEREPLERRRDRALAQWEALED